MPQPIIERVKISEGWKRWEQALRSGNASDNTIQNNRVVINRLININGDLDIRDLKEVHIEKHLLSARKDCPKSWPKHISILKSFCAFARTRKLLAPYVFPIAPEMKARAVHSPPRLRIPQQDFDALLDAAGARHPRNRAVLALCIYTLGRGGEVTSHRIADQIVGDSEILCSFWKTDDFGSKPMAPQLIDEMDQWLVEYERLVGPLKASWYLVPSLQGHRGVRDPETGLIKAGSSGDLVPSRRIGRPFDIVKQALVDCGYAIRDEVGESLREGVHTVRRSAARAMYLSMRADGHSHGEAIATVGYMLHHNEVSTGITSAYIGMDGRKLDADLIVKSGRMFGSATNEPIVPPRMQAVAEGVLDLSAARERRQSKGGTKLTLVGAEAGMGKRPNGGA